MVEFKLPEDFLMGTATASVQIEGGDTNNTWFKWCQEGNIKDKSSCFTANDHWNRLNEDIGLLKALNVNTHRMSLEWSRIEPSRGSFSRDAISHYREELKALIANNIKPLVTLHHFSEPLWFHHAGAWENGENVAYFLDYVRFVMEELGDLATEWVTFNEPNVYTSMGYALGAWPPGKVDFLKALRVQSEIIKAHLKAYALIHEIRKSEGFQGETKVGCAIHIRVFDASKPMGKIMSYLADYIFNELIMEGVTTGKIKFPLTKKGFKPSKGIFADFLGINYYTRNVVEFALKPSTLFYRETTDDRLEKTESGWDIYPDGLYRICKKYYRKYGLPIYITENGINTSVDHKKSEFICRHLAAVEKLIREGVPVERYYYWTLMDNFEWTEGESTRFGLIHCNFRNQERKMRNSGRLYAYLCKNKALTKKVFTEYDKILKKDFSSFNVK